VRLVHSSRGAADAPVNQGVMWQKSVSPKKGKTGQFADGPGRVTYEAGHSGSRWSHMGFCGQNFKRESQKRRAACFLGELSGTQQVSATAKKKRRSSETVGALKGNIHGERDNTLKTGGGVPKKKPKPADSPLVVTMKKKKGQNTHRFPSQMIGESLVWQLPPKTSKIGRCPGKCLKRGGRRKKMGVRKYEAGVAYLPLRWGTRLAGGERAPGGDDRNGPPKVAEGRNKSTRFKTP